MSLDDLIEKEFDSLQRECILFPTYAKRDPNNINQWLVNVKGWVLTHNASMAKQKVLMVLTKSVAGKSSIDRETLQIFEERFKYFLASNKRHRHFYIHSTWLDPCGPDETGIYLKTTSSGFLSGQFQLSMYDTPRFIQIQSTCIDHRLKVMPHYGKVNMIEPEGISIISDIDDTIKDTQILSGARTVLSKTFFEHPEGVKGMSDAYMQWYRQGASFHYVSNSPFQLMPMLEKFLREGNFPPGSIHLRDDSKFLSRLVETPGQAKREAIVQILQDFPQRQFILIGDSGEVDLEIYSRLAHEYPGQILKIFIRNVKREGRFSMFSSKRRTQSSPALDLAYRSDGFRRTESMVEVRGSLQERLEKARALTDVQIVLFRDPSILL